MYMIQIIQLVFIRESHDPLFLQRLVSQQAEGTRVISFLRHTLRLLLADDGLDECLQHEGCAVFLRTFSQNIFALVLVGRLRLPTGSGKGDGIKDVMLYVVYQADKCCGRLCLLKIILALFGLYRTLAAQNLFLQSVELVGDDRVILSI